MILVFHQKIDKLSKQNKYDNICKFNMQKKSKTKKK